jgi:hypothetical protein
VTADANGDTRNAAVLPTSPVYVMPFSEYRMIEVIAIPHFERGKTHAKLKGKEGN